VERALFSALVLLLVATLALPAAISEGSPEKPVVVVFAKGLADEDVQLKAAIGNETFVEWRVVTGELARADLEDAVMLIAILADYTQEYTSAELAAIADWFDEGGKALWVAGDSDYGDDGPPRQSNANKLLEAVGSKLRIESAAVEDPVSNAGKPYRVLGLSEKCDPEVSFLAEGVTRALFHGPAPIVCYVGGEYVKLEEERVENVYRVMWTSSEGMIVNHNPPEPEAHEVGDTGSFVVMAIEVIPEKECVVIATGDAPFDHYTGTYMPELKRYDRYAVEYPQQGGMLVRNVLLFASRPGFLAEALSTSAELEGAKAKVGELEAKVAELEEEVGAARSSALTYAIAGLIAGLVVGSAAGYLIGRRK